MALRGHTYAVRRIKFSPHNASLLGSVSYDMSCRLWDTGIEDAIVQTAQQHSEFVLGLDFNLFVPGQMATCSWDRHLCIWDTNAGPPPPLPPPLPQAQPPTGAPVAVR